MDNSLIREYGSRLRERYGFRALREFERRILVNDPD